MADFIIAHLYPDIMNLYGDRGNIICLQKRIEWLGYNCRIKSISLQEEWDINKVDMVYMGSGSERVQALVYADLKKSKDTLGMAINNGLPVLCIGGAFQLLGTNYFSGSGEKREGLNLLAFHTLYKPERFAGNIAVKVSVEGREYIAIGFENHNGRTYFDDFDLKAWGRVIIGYGNNGKDAGEGILYKNLVGTYMHGPLLPKNPIVADSFIKAMARRRNININNELDNSLEDFSHAQVLKYMTKKKT